MMMVIMDEEANIANKMKGEGTTFVVPWWSSNGSSSEG